MKRVLTILGLVLVLGSCRYTTQEMTDDSSRILCGESTCLATYVFDKSKTNNTGSSIVWSSYDPMSKANDSLIKERQRQADSIISLLKSLK